MEPPLTSINLKRGCHSVSFWKVPSNEFLYLNALVSLHPRTFLKTLLLIAPQWMVFLFFKIVTNDTVPTLLSLLAYEEI